MPAPSPSDLAGRFERFGRIETLDASPLYARLALAIARDPALLALAAECAPGQPAPNLFLGAVHYLLLRSDGEGDPLRTYYPSLLRPGEPGETGAGLEDAFRTFCLAHAAEIAGLVRNRRVQTNEVGRCAALLPAFSLAAGRTEAALWLVEIGASAGLNLYWDRYAYSYLDESGAVVRQLGSTGSPVQLTACLRGQGRPSFPGALPLVANRIGIDLHPVDVHDADAVAWLRALIWPEHADRVEKLLAAVELVRAEPSAGVSASLLAGDALDLLPAVLAGAPRDPVLVVVHTFTLNQFTEEERRGFRSLLAEASRDRDVVEIGIEMVSGESYARLKLGYYREGAADVRQLALCDGHVRWLEWRTRSGQAG